jgi:hypothetical protein
LTRSAAWAAFPRKRFVKRRTRRSNCGDVTGVAGGAIAIRARFRLRMGGRRAETACERPHKALPRKRHGTERETTTRSPPCWRRVRMSAPGRRCINMRRWSSGASSRTGSSASMGSCRRGCEISQKAELSSAGSDAGSRLWCKMPFRSYLGSRVLATAAQAVEHEGPAAVPE